MLTLLPAARKVRLLLLACRRLAPVLLVAGISASCIAQEPKGVIAYVRDHKEIRTISADGTGDKLLWAHPRPDIAENLGISDVAWRPDGKELAFASSHEAATSLFDSDIFAVRADGSGCRRITNPPALAELNRFPQGKVVVTVANDRTHGPGVGLFIVYVAGADRSQTAIVSPGNSATVTFEHVAKLGDVSQPVVAMNGQYRWAIPGIRVQAGQTVKAPPLVLIGKGLRHFGAFQPVWRPDGEQIGYILSSGAGIWSVSAQGKPGFGPDKPVGETNKSGAGAFDWGPSDAAGGAILHIGSRATRDNNVYQVGVDGGVRKKRSGFEAEVDHMIGVRWLPDGTGFLYARTDNRMDSANLYRHDFATGSEKKITNYKNQFVREFRLSPDGGWVVYELAPLQYDSIFAKDKKPDIWIMRVDGSGQRLLVKNGYAPSWRL